MPEMVDDNHNPRAAYAGCIVRLVGHDLMDFRLGGRKGSTGGADACINFNEPLNKGLSKCIAEFDLKRTYGRFCTSVSLADYLVIAAEAVMGRMATDYNADDHFAAGTTLANFMDNFKYGR